MFLETRPFSFVTYLLIYLKEIKPESLDILFHIEKERVNENPASRQACFVVTHSSGDVPDDWVTKKKAGRATVCSILF